MTEIRKTADLKADAAIAASLEGVSHRYGKTVALDNVTLTIPGGCMLLRAGVIASVTGARKQNYGAFLGFRACS